MIGRLVDGVSKIVRSVWLYVSVQVTSSEVRLFDLKFDGTGWRRPD
jgi:hypothetical protein